MIRKILAAILGLAIGAHAAHAQYPTQTRIFQESPAGALQSTDVIPLDRVAPLQPLGHQTLNFTPPGLLNYLSQMPNLGGGGTVFSDAIPITRGGATFLVQQSNLNLFSADGSSTVPAQAFANAPTTGRYRYPNATTLGLAIGGSIGEVVNGVENMTIGSGSDIFYANGGVRMSNGPLAIRNMNATSCFDLADGLSVLVNQAAGGRSPVSGGCYAGPSFTAGYGGGDVVGIEALTSSNNIQIYANVSFGAGPAPPNSRIYPASGTTFNVSNLHPYSFINLNNSPATVLLGAVVYQFDPGGAWIDTLGWAVYQGGGGQVDPLSYSTAGGYNIVVNPSQGTFGAVVGAVLTSSGANAPAKAGIFAEGFEIDLTNATGLTYDYQTDIPHTVGLDLLLGGGDISWGIGVATGSHFGVIVAGSNDADYLAGLRPNTEPTTHAAFMSTETAGNVLAAYNGQGPTAPFFSIAAVTGNVLTSGIITDTGMPTSCTSQPTGTLWNNSGTVNVC